MNFENIFCGLRFLTFFDAFTFFDPLGVILTVNISISGDESGTELFVLASTIIPSSVSSRMMVSDSAVLFLPFFFKIFGINGLIGSEWSSLAFLELFGVENLDFDNADKPIDDRFLLYIALCLIFAADLRRGVDFTFWILLKVGVCAGSF